MRRTPRAVVALLFVGAVVAGAAGSLAAQAVQQGESKTLTLTTASNEARQATMEAGQHFFNMNAPRAKAELADEGPAANLGRAIVADAMAKAGNKADAQALKAEIMASGTATLFDVLARAKVQKL